MIFDPSDYLALPDCLEPETVDVSPGRSVSLDIAAVKLNQLLLRQYFSSLPKYESWKDFLPATKGNELLARLAVLIGYKAGAWDLKSGVVSFSYPEIKHPKARVPKPSRGDLET